MPVSDSKRRRTRGRRPWWWSHTDDELLDLRLCELDLRLEGTWVEQCVARLHRELSDCGLRVRPHVWLSSEWFSPDGIPGIAVPFYLVDERLTRLEKRKMLEAEGGSERECMRLLRHEAGHALCSAFRLHHRQSWRNTFGHYSAPYPDSYVPNARSKDFVVHLRGWYAQAHPAEDFAETFAVWLSPHARWWRDYDGWPAVRKLEYVDQLMERIAGQTPPVRSRRFVEPIGTLRTTLREYYEEKQQRFGAQATRPYDDELRRLFSDDPRHRRRTTAVSFLRRVRPRIREVVVRWTGEYPYAVDQVLADMIERCRELGLRLAASESQTLHEAIVAVAVQTTRFLHRVPHRIAL